jgi:hypothetical protein
MATLEARRSQNKTKKKERKKRGVRDDGPLELRRVWQVKHDDLYTTVSKKGGTKRIMNAGHVFLQFSAPVPILFRVCRAVGVEGYRAR